MNQPDFEFKIVTGKEILPFLDTLAELRITIFREYPYLYDGDLEYEKRYLHKFSEAKDACVIVISFGNQVVGALSGLALSSEDELIYNTWVSFPDFESMYYVSEILILRAFRKYGLGKQVFSHFNDWIKKSDYTKTVLATVDRSDEDSRKPLDYISLNNFWNRNGFVFQPDKCCFISWKEIGEKSESMNKLYFWLREE